MYAILVQYIFAIAFLIIISTQKGDILKQQFIKHTNEKY